MIIWKTRSSWRYWWPSCLYSTEMDGLDERLPSLKKRGSPEEESSCQRKGLLEPAQCLSTTIAEKGKGKCFFFLQMNSTVWLQFKNAIWIWKIVFGIQQQHFNLAGLLVYFEACKQNSLEVAYLAKHQVKIQPAAQKQMGNNQPGLPQFSLENIPVDFYSIKICTWIQNCVVLPFSFLAEFLPGCSRQNCF